MEIFCKQTNRKVTVSGEGQIGVGMNLRIMADANQGSHSLTAQVVIVLQKLPDQDPNRLVCAQRVSFNEILPFLQRGLRARQECA
jgi:hypothetical protein